MHADATQSSVISFKKDMSECFFSYLKIIRISVSQIMYFCFEVDEYKGVKVKVEQ